jgi:hypothetical protein
MTSITRAVRTIKTTRTIRTVTTVVAVVRALLRFGQGNAKLNSAIFTFSLPAGHTCPFARECKSKVSRTTGRIQDGKHTRFRCSSATEELRPNVRESRWRNLRLLRACKSTGAMVQLILESLSPLAGFVRIHTSGDFFSQAYFDAWLEVARRRPETLFYAYTKSLPYVIRRKDELPANLILTASYGGSADDLIEEHGLRSALVVLSEEEAYSLGLEIDHNDSHAMNPGPSFALLIHGSQPAGTDAAKAIAALRAQGEYGYGEKADAARVRHGRLPLSMVS